MILHIMSRWGDECFYRMFGGAVQSLRQSGAWADTRDYGTDLASVIDYFCEGGADENWSYEWVKESDAKYATEG